MILPPSKGALRAGAARAISAIPSSERARWDTVILGHLRSLEEFRAAEQILAYLALPDEPDLRELLAAAISHSTPVFVPVVHSAADMTFSRWWPRDGYIVGPEGSWAPSDIGVPAAVPSIALLPGRGFDLDGYRLGRGRGCYDRILDAMRSFATVVGVAYDCQIVPSLPREPHDRRVDIVVTERRTCRVRESGHGGSP